MVKRANLNHKIFNLDDDSIKNLEEGAKLNGMNKSEFVRFLANSWEKSIDPTKKLSSIQSEKNIIKERLASIEEEEQTIIKLLQRKDEWNTKRQEIKPNIIRNLIRIIGEGRYMDAEVIAKNQSIPLGISAIQLLSEASEIIKNGQ